MCDFFVQDMAQQLYLPQIFCHEHQTSKASVSDIEDDVPPLPGNGEESLQSFTFPFAANSESDSMSHAGENFSNSSQVCEANK